MCSSDLELLLLKNVKSKDHFLIAAALINCLFFSFFLLPAIFFAIKISGLNIKYINLISANLVEICINLFFLSVNNVFFYYFLKISKFKYISVSKMAQSASFVFFIFLFKNQIRNPSEIIVADTFSRIIFLLVHIDINSVNIACKYLKFLKIPDYFRETVVTLRQNARNSGFLTLASILNAIAAQIPLAIFSSTLTAYEFGAYAIVERVIHVPFAFLATSIGQTYINTLREDSKKAYFSIKKFFYTIFVLYFLFSLAIYLLFNFSHFKNSTFIDAAPFLFLTLGYYPIEFVFFVYYQSALVYFPRKQFLFDFFRIGILIAISILIKTLNLDKLWSFLSISVGWAIIFVICDRFFWMEKFKNNVLIRSYSD